MTFPFYNPVTVQDPVDDSNPTTKIYVDNGLSGKAETGHLHDARYSQLGHTHTSAAIVSGTLDIARIPTGTSGTTVALGDHNHDAAYAPISHAHAAGDVTSGTLDIARIPTGQTGTTVPLGNDSRFTDARTPTTHASSHATGGSDPVSPASIGAAATSHAHAAGDVTSGTFAIGRIPTGTTSSTVAIGNDSRLSDARTPTAHAASHATGQSDAIAPADIGAAAASHNHAASAINSGTLDIARIPTGTSGTTVALGNDSRLSDARTPTAHVHSGADITSGTVPIAQLPTGTSGTTVALGNHDHASVYAALSHAHAAGDVTSGTFAIGRIPTGTSSTTVCIGNDSRLSDARTPTSHVHSGADITSGTVPIAQLPTGTSGTTVALGNHVHAAADVTSGTFAIARIPTGTSSSTVAIGNDTRLSVKPYPPVTLTDAATVSVDASLGNHFRLTSGSGRTLGTPSNPTDGQVIVFELKATAGVTFVFGSAYAFGSDVTAVSATVSGKTDFVQFVYCSSVSKWMCIGYIKGFTT